MVTEWLMNTFSGTVAWLMMLVTVPAPPSWLADAGGYIATVGTYVTGTGVWIPWALISAVLGGWAVVMVAMVAIKGLRIVASFLTLGGGSAA
ncbi:MAG: hypothetical protein WCI74_06225 [Actinomycetes bacterium]